MSQGGKEMKCTLAFHAKGKTETRIKFQNSRVQKIYHSKKLFTFDVGNMNLY